MIDPNTKVDFIIDSVGNGLIATQFIPKGNVTWVLDPQGPIFSPEEYN